MQYFVPPLNFPIQKVQNNNSSEKDLLKIKIMKRMTLQNAVGKKITILNEIKKDVDRKNRFISGR